MKTATAQRLAAMTGAFYAQVFESFSATRQEAWLGWHRVAELARANARGSSDVQVVDLACGNLRFERFLASELLQYGQMLHAIAYDNCDQLAQMHSDFGAEVDYRHLDIAEALFAGKDLRFLMESDCADLAVCFGYMHHVALPAHRKKVVEALVKSAKPGGLVAISFWQLSRSARLYDKARTTTAAMLPVLGLEQLEEGDYLLGWQGRTDVVRYCHDYSEREIDDLAMSVASLAHEAERFSSDGATEALNRYLVLKRA